MSPKFSTPVENTVENEAGRNRGKAGFCGVFTGPLQKCYGSAARSEAKVGNFFETLSISNPMAASIW
jgi:hypothetical protein